MSRTCNLGFKNLCIFCAGVLDLPSLVFPRSIRPEFDMHLVASGVNCARRWWRSTERPVLLSCCRDLISREGEMEIKVLYTFDLFVYRPRLKYAADPRGNISPRTATHGDRLPPQAWGGIHCLFIDLALSVSQIGLRFPIRSHVTDLQTVVRTGDLRVTLHVERCQEF